MNSDLPVDLAQYLTDLQSDPKVPDTTDATKDDSKGTSPAKTHYVFDPANPWKRCSEEHAAKMNDATPTTGKCITDEINKQITTEAQCAYVTQHCESESLINFNTFHYCTLQRAFGYEGKKYAFWPICVSTFKSKCILIRCLFRVLCYMRLCTT